MRISQIIAGEKDLPGTDVVAAVCLALNLTKEQLFCRMDSEVGGDDLRAVRKVLGERITGRPFAYIRGTREFFSETFSVNEAVLIPRPETEVLVEEALGLIGDRRDLAILDMGTGSGAIGIVIAKHTGNRVVCVDVSEAALTVALANARSIGVEGRTRFVCSDLFAAFGDRTRFDMILSNPPYVADDEWDGLMTDVRDFEPPRALRGGKGGLDVYRRIAAELPRRLAPGGRVLLEIGSSAQAGTVGAMLEEAGLAVSVRKDYSGRERVLAGHG